MRTLLMLPVLSVLSALLFVGCAQAPPTAAPDHAAIGAAIDAKSAAYLAAFASRDTSALVALYAADGHMMPANAPRSDGLDAIREGWVGVLSMPGVALSFRSDTKIISEAGDLVLDLGSYTFKFQGPDGKEISDVGKFVTVFKRVDGDWKIIVDTFNSDLPPPGM